MAHNTDEEINAFSEFIESNCPLHDTIVNTPRWSRGRQGLNLKAAGAGGSRPHSCTNRHGQQAGRPN